MPTAQKQTFHLFETMFQAIYPYTCIESQYTSLTVDTQYEELDHSPSQHQNSDDPGWEGLSSTQLS